MLLLLGYQSYDKFKNATTYSDYYPNTVKCFDAFITETGAKAGASGYWLSKRLVLLSKHEVTIAQYLTNLKRYEWVSTKSWYKNKYDFFLIDSSVPRPHQLDKKVITTRFGKPEKEYKCQYFDILYYP